MTFRPPKKNYIKKPVPVILQRAFEPDDFERYGNRLLIWFLFFDKEAIVHPVCKRKLI